MDPCQEENQGTPAPTMHVSTVCVSLCFTHQKAVEHFFPSPTDMEIANHRQWVRALRGGQLGDVRDRDWIPVPPGGPSTLT